MCGPGPQEVIRKEGVGFYLPPFSMPTRKQREKATSLVLEQIATLYKEGLSTRQLAKILDVSASTIQVRLRLIGLIRSNAEAIKNRKYRHTPEKLEKMRRAALGRKHSVETKAKISKSHLGKLNPNYGKHPSLETRAKLSASHTGIKNPFYGKHHSAQTLQIILQIKPPNKQEQKVQNLLDVYFPGEWKFVGDGQLIIGGLCPDFTNINGKKCLIELFGDHWHSGSMVESWTRTELGRIMCYNSYGYKCLVIWEHELKDEKALVGRLKKWQNCKSL